MSKTKILIVEDEAITSEYMVNKLKKAGYEITGCFDNGEEAINSAKAIPPDLIFLDILIEGKDDGIETAKKLKLIENFPIIFLTNLHDEKTLQRARAISPANYLLKPFADSQLYVSIENALYNISEKKDAKIKEDGLIDKDKTLAITNDKLFIKNSRGVYQKYNISDILYLKAERTYCRIYIENGEELLQTTDMKDIWMKINHPNFIKAHRSYVVNIDKIDAVKGNMVIINKHEITVTPEHKDEIFQHLNIVR
jgi:DNA-binding LytR/AlgR family response regulator